MYNGVTMKIRYIYPQKINLQYVNLSKKAETRLTWLDWYYGHGCNARLTCRHFGISPDTLYRWINRFNPKDLRTLESVSTKPHHVRKPTTKQEVVSLIMDIRKTNPAWSKYKIQVILKREHKVIVSASTIGRLLKRRNLINLKQYGYKRRHTKRLDAYKVKRKRATKNLKYSYPGSLMQVDTKRLNIFGTTYYQFTAIDTFTRMSYSNVYSTITSKSGERFLKEVFNYFPFKTNLQSDNGSEFLLHFHKYCKETKTEHYFTYPRCPKQNSNVERKIQTTEYEFWDYQDDLYPCVKYLQEKIQQWNITYNTYRPHQSLDYKTPLEYYDDYLEERFDLVNEKVLNFINYKVYGM